MLQRLTQTLLNNRLCMVMPFPVAGCHPPFCKLPCIIHPCVVFQLSRTGSSGELPPTRRTLPDRYRPVKPLLELSLRPVDGNRTRAPCLASIDDTISPLRSMTFVIPPVLRCRRVLCIFCLSRPNNPFTCQTWMKHQHICFYINRVLTGCCR